MLRRWLWEQGFDIEQERLALAAGRWYTAIGAAYTGQRRQPTWEECLLGRWQGLPGAAGYAAQLAKKLEKVLRGLEPGGEEWKEAAALAERLPAPSISLVEKPLVFLLLSIQLSWRGAGELF